MKKLLIISLSAMILVFIPPVNSKQDLSEMNYQPSLRAYGKLLDCETTQVSLSLGDLYGYQGDQVDKNDVTITFHTKAICADLYIQIQQANQISSSRTQENVHSVFDEYFCHNMKDCEGVKYDRYIHHFKINLLVQGPFSYQIIGEQSDSSLHQQIYDASVPSRNFYGQQKFIYFGDLDNAKISENTFELLDVLINEDIEAFIFLGDYGYQFYQNNGKQGDKYLTSIQPYASKKPWMTTAGNHEDNFNYTFFNDKFRMPNYLKSNNHYYSFDVGLVHFISLNLDFYNNGNDAQSAQVKQQMIDWLAQDLQQANGNRDQVPWIIGFGHKSIYCVSSECNEYPELYALFDDLFYQNGVDLFIGAHKHEYQFLKPLYNQIIQGYERPDENTMKNPKATVYVVQGNGGNINMMQSELGAKHEEYLLANDGEPGLGRLTVIDKNEIMLEYIRAKSQNVKDYQRIIKDSHQAY